MSRASGRRDDSMQKIAAVVVTYNRKAMLLECIAHLATQTVACDILVVDNASTDGTGDAVRALNVPGLQYRNTGANIGGAGGFNFGMRWAVECGYDGVWVMDDDAFPAADALEQLLKADEMLSGEYGFLSGAVLWRDGSGCKMNVPNVARGYGEDMALVKDGLIRVDQATFVSMLVPAQVVRSAGLPIKEFFIWGDDVEFSRRIAVRMGMPCYLVGRSVTTHMMGVNAGSDIATDVPERIERYRLAFRNENYLYRQEGWRGRVYYVRRLLANIKNILLKSKNCRWTRVCALVCGAAAGCVFKPQVEFVPEGKEK